MLKKRIFATLGILMAVIGFSLAIPTEAQALPCYDLWNGCQSGGGSTEYCDGMWCGCMYSRYGYVCTAADM